METDLGPTVRQTDLLDPARAHALFVALGHATKVEAGDLLPPFFHQVYFWDPRIDSELGRDGHPVVGGLVPDMGLPRRMWAGGRMTFHAPIQIGQKASKTSVCEKAVHKSGRSGSLAFVTLRHEIWQNQCLCITEWQDLVYREDPEISRGVTSIQYADTNEEASVKISFNETTLFRYSALTFNGHRIHYDQNYAKAVEGYDGLVVHGPLLAQHLMLMAQQTFGTLKSFAFRATSPLMHFEEATLCQKGRKLWVRAPDGRLCMTAQI